MRIKDSGGHTRFSDHLAAVLRRRRLLVGIVLFVAYSAGMVFLGTVAQQKDLPGKLNRIIPASWKHPGNYIQGIISNPDKITIDIKHKDFKKLAYLRQCALQKGVIATAPDSYVPAKIRLDGKTVKVQVRLKGDIIDHIQGDKWSLRIKVQKNGSVYGMKRFSIQDPKLCSYVNEWILHQLYKHEGLISLRYRFVTVVINGKNKGIYALEENFSKELVEHNERREGPILKFDETHLWDGSRANYGVSNSQADIFFSSNVDTFRTKKTFSDPALRTNYFIAKQLLEDFRAGKIRVSEAFDLPRLAKLYALANLTSSEHALRWKNVRFYYDPITRKLEAIGYNAYTTRMGLGHRRNIIMWHDRYRSRHVVPEYQNLFFQDKDFVRLYMKTLDRISRKEYMDRFFESIASDLKKNMAILYSAYPDLVLSTADFYRNQRNIHGILNPSIPAMAKMQIVKDAGAPSGKRLRLLVANTCFLPIVMDSIRIIGSKVSHPLQGEIVPGKERSKPLRYHEVRVPKDSGVDPAEAAEKGITLTYHLPELDRLLTTTIRSLQVDLSESPLIVSKDWEETLSAHEMFKVNPRNKTITIRPGDWSITGNLALPKGYRVVCSGGTTIDLLNGSTIVSYSPIRFIGTRDKEILIHSTDATGQGLVVINAQEPSVLKYVTFDRLRNPSQKGWELTGAVTFYDSPVDISHCRFSRNESEDALNTVRSRFSIDNTVFKTTSSDAFDADFCKGSITDSRFDSCGNDAIDVSGSGITLRDISITRAGDKGISIGEKSSATAENIKIANSEIGVASKDTSDIVLDNVVLRNTKIGFAAYQKKPEFGPASIRISHLQTHNVKIPYLLETQSNLTVDGKAMRASQKNVKVILYGAEYGKSSK